MILRSRLLAGRGRRRARLRALRTHLYAIAGIVLMYCPALDAKIVRSAIFYGVGNYSHLPWDIPDIPLAGPDDRRLRMPLECPPNKYDILFRRIRELIHDWEGVDEISLIFNDISTNAAIGAYLAATLQTRHISNPKIVISILQGDFFAMDVPRTDRAYLDNPEALWFYDDDKELLTGASAKARLSRLQYLANAASEGLRINSTYTAAIWRFNGRGIEFDLIGDGHPYISSSGEVKHWLTTQVLVRNNSEQSQSSLNDCRDRIARL